MKRSWRIRARAHSPFSGSAQPVNDCSVPVLVFKRYHGWWPDGRGSGAARLRQHRTTSSTIRRVRIKQPQHGFVSNISIAICRGLCLNLPSNIMRFILPCGFEPRCTCWYALGMLQYFSKAWRILSSWPAGLADLQMDSVSMQAHTCGNRSSVDIQYADHFQINLFALHSTFFW